ncbi:MAG: hypothetical protein ACO3AE_06650, partial [Robiginitalea sp.]
EMLDLEKDTSLLKDKADFEHIQGVYENKGRKFVIRWENGWKSSRFIEGDTLVSVLEVHPYANSYLLFYSKTNQEKTTTDMTRIVLGENGEVLGQTWVRDMTVGEDGERDLWKKIE